MTDPVTVRIPGAPPLPNRTVREGSWHARSRSRRSWRTAAMWAARVVHGARPPVAACDLDVEHVLPDRRRRDLDNLAAATKPLLDGLVDAGLLAGDDTTVVRSIAHRATVVRGVRETRITVTPIGEEDRP